MVREQCRLSSSRVTGLLPIRKHARGRFTVGLYDRHVRPLIRSTLGYGHLFRDLCQMLAHAYLPTEKYTDLLDHGVGEVVRRFLMRVSIYPSLTKKNTKNTKKGWTKIIAIQYDTIERKAKYLPVAGMKSWVSNQQCHGLDRKHTRHLC